MLIVISQDKDTPIILVK